MKLTTLGIIQETQDKRTIEKSGLKETLIDTTNYPEFRVAPKHFHSKMALYR